MADCSSDAKVRDPRPLPVTTPPEGVALRLISASRGRGVVATRAFKAGDVLISESPLVSSQDGANVREVLVCGQCLRPLGCVELQLDIAERRCSAARPAAPQWSLPVPPSPDGFASRDPTGALFTKGLIPCSQACGTLYCSKECERRAFREGHRLICVGRLKSTSEPLYRFKMHAIENNLDLLFAGKVMAHIVCRYLDSIKDGAAGGAASGAAEAAKRPYASFIQKKWWDVTVRPNHMRHMPQPEFERFMRNQLAASFELLQAALHGHPEVKGVSQSERSGLAAIVKLDYYASLVGMMHQNQLGIRRAHVAKDYLTFLKDYKTADKAARDASWDRVRKVMVAVQNRLEDEFDDDEDEGEDEDEDGGSGEGDENVDGDNDVDKKADGKGQDGKDGKTQRGSAGAAGQKSDSDGGDGSDEALGGEPKDEGDEGGMSIEDVLADDELVDQLLCPFDGAALFSLICTLNHSCAPNITIDYGSGFGPVKADVVALRDIAEGEELCFSYLRKKLPLEERRHELLDYGFVCVCPLCLEQAEEAKSKQKQQSAAADSASKSSDSIGASR